MRNRRKDNFKQVKNCLLAFLILRKKLLNLDEKTNERHSAVFEEGMSDDRINM